jgi:hypothetical protein
MDAEHRFHLRRIIIWTLVIALAHFLLGTRTHAVHGLHVLLAGLFLVPVLIGAVAFGTVGGVLTALAAGVLYLAHILWSWRESPLTNADQYAMIGVYFIVGIAAGRLVSIANFRKWQRDEVIRRAYEESKGRAQ